MVMPCASPPIRLRVTFLRPMINSCNTSAVKAPPRVLAHALRQRGDFISIFHMCKQFNASQLELSFFGANSFRLLFP